MKSLLVLSTSLALGGLLATSVASAGTLSAHEATHIARTAGRFAAIDQHARNAAVHTPQRTVQFTRRVLGIPGWRRSITALQAGGRAVSRNPFRRSVQARVVQIINGKVVEPLGNKGRVTLRRPRDWHRFTASAIAAKDFTPAELDVTRAYDPAGTGQAQGFDRSVDHGTMLRSATRKSNWARRGSIALKTVGATIFAGTVVVSAKAIVDGRDSAAIATTAFAGIGVAGFTVGFSPELDRYAGTVVEKLHAELAR